MIVMKNLTFRVIRYSLDVVAVVVGIRSSAICCLASAKIDRICSGVKSCVEILVAEKSILIRFTEQYKKINKKQNN